VNCRSFGLKKPPQEVLDTSTSAAAEALLFNPERSASASTQQASFTIEQSIAARDDAHEARAKRCRKASVRHHSMRDERKSLTTNPTQLKERHVITPAY
jgi:hypothetical protein